MLCFFKAKFYQLWRKKTRTVVYRSSLSSVEPNRGYETSADEMLKFVSTKPPRGRSSSRTGTPDRDGTYRVSSREVSPSPSTASSRGGVPLSPRTSRRRQHLSPPSPTPRPFPVTPGDFSVVSSNSDFSKWSKQQQQQQQQYQPDQHFLQHQRQQQQQVQQRQQQQQLSSVASSSTPYYIQRQQPSNYQRYQQRLPAPIVSYSTDRQNREHQQLLQQQQHQHHSQQQQQQRQQQQYSLSLSPPQATSTPLLTSPPFQKSWHREEYYSVRQEYPQQQQQQQQQQRQQYFSPQQQAISPLQQHSFRFPTPLQEKFFNQQQHQWHHEQRQQQLKQQQQYQQQQQQQQQHIQQHHAMSRHAHQTSSSSDSTTLKSLAQSSGPMSSAPTTPYTPSRKENRFPLEITGLYSTIKGRQHVSFADSAGLDATSTSAKTTIANTTGSEPAPPPIPARRPILPPTPSAHNKPAGVSPVSPDILRQISHGATLTDPPVSASASSPSQVDSSILRQIGYGGILNPPSEQQPPPTSSVTVPLNYGAKVPTRSSEMVSMSSNQQQQVSNQYSTNTSYRDSTASSASSSRVVQGGSYGQSPSFIGYDQPLYYSTDSLGRPVAEVNGYISDDIGSSYTTASSSAASYRQHERQQQQLAQQHHQIAQKQQQQQQQQQQQHQQIFQQLHQQQQQHYQQQQLQQQHQPQQLIEVTDVTETALIPKLVAPDESPVQRRSRPTSKIVTEKQIDEFYKSQERRRSVEEEVIMPKTKGADVEHARVLHNFFENRDEQKQVGVHAWCRISRWLL